jgi:hypothetical protein
MQRVRRHAWMNVVGAVRSLFRSVPHGARRRRRFAFGSIPIAGDFMLGVQFPFGLQPMGGLHAVRPPGLLPNLMGPPRDAFVSDWGNCIHSRNLTSQSSLHNRPRPTAQEAGSADRRPRPPRPLPFAADAKALRSDRRRTSAPAWPRGRTGKPGPLRTAHRR